MAKKAGGGFMAPVQPDDVLAEIVGSKPIPRTKITSLVWDHIKENTNAQEGRNIHISRDEKLQALAPKKKVITMFELTSIVSQHINKAAN